MADAAISFAVQRLGDLVIQKVGFVRDVEDEVKWLKDELQRMQCFLKDATEKQANDQTIHKWISDIREVAQDSEDAIETFILKVESPRRTKGRLRRYASFPNHVYRLHRLGKEIKSIRARLQDIDKSRQRYGIRNVGDGTALPSSRSGDVERRRLSPWQIDKHVVGLEKDVNLVLQKAVLGERKGLSVTTIAGMGGIGKSTLARILYNHDKVAKRFERRAWVSVSSEFNAKEIIKELVLQLLESREDKLKMLEIMEKLQLPALQNMLHERLQGRGYFIVLDDVWQEAAWESLASAFPDEQVKASRLLVTSRNSNIPRCAGYVHQLKTLNHSQSWELFLKKAFVDNTNGKCPQELEEIGSKIVRKCDGLPLAIAVIGGLLVKQRPSKSEWEKILRGMNSQFGRNGNGAAAILELSYYDLPPQLKPCFLCLGFFKEDATIRTRKLVEVWIAEGLVSEQGGEETMEEIARGYLDELINRNIVQVKDMSKDDGVKSCQIHDLLRDLSIRKAKEEINFEILRDPGNSQSSDKSRHHAIYFNTERFTSSKSPNRHLRSLFFHGAGNIHGIPSYKWKSFELLRVLDFEDFGLKNLPYTIGKLTGLRYLGLRNNNLSELPRSLRRLKNLQVLDIAGNVGLRVSNVIWEMDSLRHLYMFNITYKGTLKINILKNLQTLAYIPVDNWLLERTMQMTNLRKLGMYLDKDTEVSKLCTSLATLENLVCLKLSWSFGPLSMDGLVVLHRLTQLKLVGQLTSLPSASNFPPNLSHLSLHFSLLRDDPMPVLEKLLNLLYLKLSLTAYCEEKMAISHKGFPRLRVLSLWGLFNLRNIRLIGKGGMPELKRLEINKCPNLKNLPRELRFMSNLQIVEDGNTQW